MLVFNKFIVLVKNLINIQNNKVVDIAKGPNVYFGEVNIKRDDIIK